MESFNRLIRLLKQFPTIGNKSAQRLALYLFSMPENNFQEFIGAVQSIKKDLKYCSRCYNISSQDPCEICADSKRDHSTLCLVADQKDLMVIEKTSAYKGLYHVLGGLISPIDGIYPEMLKIEELISRLKKIKPQELIMAINPTVEGEATIIYLNKIIAELNLEIKITRIAYGLPMGADLDYVDETTIVQALSGRVNL